MPEPLAYFLTWTTYGTWLPGDGRGWVHHEEGAWHVPYREPKAGLEANVKQRMNESAITLAPEARAIVEQAIRESCRVQGWGLQALAVRSNHVHVVVTAPGVHPDAVLKRFKAYASRALSAAGVDERRKRWTRHGSTRYLNTQHSLIQAVHYVENQ